MVGAALEELRCYGSVRSKSPEERPVFLEYVRVIERSIECEKTILHVSVDTNKSHHPLGHDQKNQQRDK
jgi:hypothetical protein